LDSNALNLCLYFDEVKALSTNASVNDRGKIQHALCYASREDNKLWATLSEAQLPNYAKFQDAIMKLYPRADDEKKYAESDLHWSIDTQKKYGIESRAELRHYYWKFHCISKLLLDKQCLSNIEWNKMYMRGLDEWL
jgi:hypothetical protein